LGDVSSLRGPPDRDSTTARELHVKDLCWLPHVYGAHRTNLRVDGALLHHRVLLHCAPSFCAAKREQERGREESDLPYVSASLSLRRLSEHGVVPVIEHHTNRLQDLCEEGLFSMSHEGRVPNNRPILSPLLNKAISVAAFNKQCLQLMTHDFLRRLLIYYGLKLHHLTQGRVLHITAFIMMCEAFQGILPHFSLWKYLFYIGVEVGPLRLIGGVILQPRPGRARQYLQLLLATSDEGWRGEWFWIQNSISPLPVFTDAAPMC
jgi:hypothetical protein